ncbi:MAG: hypothetical protein QGI75_03735 [Phycisphaerales bacterium]|jgi:hypothetical protein|nr:hypothetical protein [Phycisphaerales bacterium]MDP6987640.1 hypothetical protein [Phycisphaerales bacterium]
MHPLRRGLAHRLIVLLLAAVMPLCCCLVKGVAAVPSGEAPVVATCCCDSSSTCDGEDQSSGQEPCGSCCCVKAPATAENWTPPSDEIGVTLPPIAIEMSLTCDLAARAPVVSTATDAQSCGPWGVSAPPLRHATILQV